jgi:CheY-like chemotaxis protein
MASEILVVDDEPLQLRAVSRALKPGYQVRVATTVEETVREVSQSPPALLLLDYLLDGVNGVRLARALRNGGFRGRIAIVTGMLESEELDEAVACGDVDLILRKPWSLEELESTVQRLLGP